MRIWMLILVCLLPSLLPAADWPMWRHNPGRTAASTEQLPSNLALKWTRDLPALTPAFRDERLQFDRGYEPIVLGQRLFVGSSYDDSVTAFDTTTGDELWRFQCDGPVRFAPVAGKGRVMFGSDDGHFYCVKASTGQQVWKFQAVPSDRQLIGNGRLISVWPVRGGPVLKDDRVYFAAGVWPLEGVFVYCLDVGTGKVIWLNDRTSYLYGQHPHGTEGFGGLAPQGYLVIDGDELVVPCSSAYPATLDLATGKLKKFELPSAGRLPGGWFTSTPSDRETLKLKRRGLLFDKEVNKKRHEDRPRDSGLAGIRSKIQIGDQDFNFADGFEGVDGTIHGMVAGDKKLFVVTAEGRLYCFGEHSGQTKTHARRTATVDGQSALVDEVVRRTGIRNGYAVAFGGDRDLLASLVSRTDLKVVGFDENAQNVDQKRAAITVSAERCSIQVGNPSTANLPRYFANLVFIKRNVDQQTVERLYESLRPFGGCMVVPRSVGQLAKTSKLQIAKFEAILDDWMVITRDGPLPGSKNYVGDWKANGDSLVKAPLGVLWFGDQVSHFKRSPQPRILNGVMVSIDKDWLDATNRKGGKDYRLLEPKFSDVYTGRAMTSVEVAEVAERFGDVDRETVQPSQYRPPGVRIAPKGVGLAGMRINPLTLEQEVRIFPKQYGCDGGLDYGLMFTMRSATAAFYDKRTDSGTINISGPRSGCTNSIIPANGLLNVPYFYEGCTCSYPLPMALSMVSMPEEFEQWASWGKVPFQQLDGKIQRLGLNFGAPGDRKTDDGTLWLNHPDIGGPSPELKVEVEPKQTEPFYRHSLFMKGGDGWPWLTASGLRGVRSIKVSGFKPGNYTVKLYFVSMNDDECVLNVAVNDKPSLTGLDVKAESDGLMRGLVKAVSNVQINGTLTVMLQADKGATSICGMEVVSMD